MVKSHHRIQDDQEKCTKHEIVALQPSCYEKNIYFVHFDYVAGNLTLHHDEKVIRIHRTNKKANFDSELGGTLEDDVSVVLPLEVLVEEAPPGVVVRRALAVRAGVHDPLGLADVGADADDPAIAASEVQIKASVSGVAFCFILVWRDVNGMKEKWYVSFVRIDRSGTTEAPFRPICFARAILILTQLTYLHRRYHRCHHHKLRCELET